MRPDQKDIDSLPPYDVLDAILEDYVEDLHTAEQIAADHNFDLALVRRVIRMVDGAEYKRQQAAPGLKISLQGFRLRPPLSHRRQDKRVMTVFHVVFEDRVQHVVRRQRVNVLLIGTQFSRGRLLQSRLRDHRPQRIHVMAQAIDQCLGHVRDHRQATDHVPIQRAVSDAKFAFISGAENDGPELVGDCHQQRAAGAGLYIFFSRVFLAAGENLLQCLAVTLEDVGNAEQLEANPEIAGQRPGVVDRTRG